MAMSHELICSWLELPAAAWPPDHYQLLGLTPGTWDAARLEEQVHLRLNRVRCYQLAQPELATEAMNRLAEAYACLSDPAAKRAYDHTHNVQPVTTAPAGPHWHDAAQPSRSDTVLAQDTPAEPLYYNPTEGAVQAPTLRPSVPTEPLARTACDSFHDLAWSSEVAQQGLFTRRDLYNRIILTRALLYAWRRTARYLQYPRRRLTKLGEMQDLKRWLHRIDDCLLSYPALLGKPGLPGYRIAVLAQDEEPTTVMQQLSFAERVAVSLDWSASLRVLREHLAYLRSEVKKLRRQSWLQQRLRPLYGVARARPWLFTLLALAVLVLLGINLFVR